MTIMDVIRRMGKNSEESKEKFKEAEENMRIQHKLEERQKSSNERELERYYKEQREAEIKGKLNTIHKQQNKDNWKSNSILSKGASILKNDRPVLKEDKNILENNNKLLSGKNIFLDKRNDIPFTKNRKGMFFK